MVDLTSWVFPVLPKLIYFSLFFSFGLCGPFFPLLLKGLVPEPLVGVTLGLMQLIWVFFPPLWSMLVDYTRRPRLFLGFLVVFPLGLRAFGIHWLNPDMNPIWAVSVFVVGELFFCGAIPICDDLVTRHLAELNSAQSFGKQRLWGAVGWGLAAPVSSLIFGISPSIHLSWSLFAAWISSFSVIAVLFFVSRPPPGPPKHVVSIREALKSTKLRWQQVCFFLVVIPAGFSSGTISTWLSPYLKVLAPAPEVYLRMVGLAVLVMIVSEVPFMYFSDRIQARIGTFSCLLIGMVCYALRCLGYSLLPEGNGAWFVLLIEPAHGITFGVFYSASITYVARAIAKEGSTATWQGVYSACFSLGKAAGSIGGGYLYGAGGGAFLYRVAFLITLGATLLFAGVVFTDRGFVASPSETLVVGKELEMVEAAFSADEDDDDKFLIDRHEESNWE